MLRRSQLPRKTAGAIEHREPISTIARAVGASWQVQP
jgi:hypothetical protein